MRIILLQILILLVFGCRSQTGETPKQFANQIPEAEIAVKFLNDYFSYCDIRSPNKNLFQWIDNYPLLTSSFKKAHQKLIEDAEKTDPELGLDFDPIFDAQDYPSGFMIKNMENNGFITLQGKDWQEFIVTVKLTHDGNKWLVDGAGIINIPKEKQAKR